MIKNGFEIKFIVKQLNSMIDALSKNIESARSLFATYKSLGGIIIKLKIQDNIGAVNQETIKQLEEIRKNISKSIEEILQNTNYLLNAYKEMADCI